MPLYVSQLGTAVAHKQSYQHRREHLRSEVPLSVSKGGVTGSDRGGITAPHVTITRPFWKPAFLGYFSHSRESAPLQYMELHPC